MNNLKPHFNPHHLQHLFFVPHPWKFTFQAKRLRDGQMMIHEVNQWHDGQLRWSLTWILGIPWTRIPPFHHVNHQQSATTSLALFTPKYPLSFGSESLRFSRSGRLTVSPRDMTTMAHFLNLGFSDAIRHWIPMEKTYVVSVGERSQKTGAFVHVPAKNGPNAVNILGFLVNILVWKMPLTSMVMTDSSFIIMRSMESKWKETSKCLIATKYHPSSVILKTNLSIVKPKWQCLNHAISVGFNPVFNCCVSPRGFRPYKLQSKQPDSHRSFQYLLPMVSTLLQQYRIKHALF